MADQKRWKLLSKKAFERYIAALEQDLPPNWTLKDIEQVMEKHYQAFMESTKQALIDGQDFPPYSS